ncbi:SusC/RagA family TonB-linked outer membrane protein [Flavobacterium supellecticarium]|uniref:SusC/RagA family TonB-linked outer membrane protein n=1 Tax=Flavobacterium supellecticarium TaxID=2565924 RepID=A0A4S3ZZ90_9FLAO|nr:SusC/RagA family TonB-linked outer membrane protein [Flavobacterium supellecticarium]THF51308.1 SusC/RagA family TonB-linked outer membrane protein [Flavobacterium supellecticarium]
MRSKFKWIFTLLLAFSMQFSFAQQEKTVTGTVTEGGLPLPGVSVVIKGTTQGTQTDMDGNYSIKAKQGQVLVFTFVGMETSSVTVGASNKINVALQSEAKQLNEVVVGALGIKKRQDAITSANQVVKAKELTQAASPNAIQSLTGKVSGLQINQTNSAVDGTMRIVIRAPKSITQNNQALVVIDGVISTATALQQLPTEAIESINTIKGSQGAALYGSDGVNGVLIVTTKKGSTQGQKMSISVNSSIDFTNVAYLPERQTRYGQGWDGQHYSYENGTWGPEFDGSIQPTGLPQADGSFLMLPYRSLGSDNIKKFFKTGVLTQNGVSLSSGNEDGYLFFTANKLKNEFIVQDDVLDRTNFQFKAGKKIGRWNVEGNAQYTTQESRTTSSSLYYDLLQTPTNVPIEMFENGGNLHGYSYYMRNPYWVRDNVRNQSNTDVFNGIGKIGFEVNKNINISYTAGVNLSSTKALSYSNDYVDPYRYGNGNQSVISSLSTSNGSTRRLYADLLINFDYDLTKDLNLKVNIGNNVQDVYATSTGTSGSQLAIPGLYNISNVSSVPNATNSFARSRRFAFFGNVDLGYKDYLFLNLTGRNEWVSFLDKSNNNFFYPSAGLSFIPTKAIESLKDNNVLSYAKITASIVKVGSANGIAAYDINNLYTRSTGYPFNGVNSYVPNVQPTIAYNSRTNPYIKPEFYLTKEASLNLGFLKDRITLDVAGYISDNTDLITTISSSYASGNPNYATNIGATKTKGIEIDLGITPIKTKDFTWDARFSFSKAKTTVEKVADNTNSVAIYSPYGTYGIFAEEGEEYPIIKGFGYQRDGEGRIIVDPNTGNPLKSTELMKLGKTTPDYILGLNTSIDFKGLRLAAVMDYRTGHQYYSGTKNTLTNFGYLVDSAENGRGGFIMPNSSYLDANTGTYVANNSVVTGGGSSIGVQQYYANIYSNIDENYILDATAFKVRELSLSYAIPAKMLERTGLTSLRVGVNARNPFTVLARENRGYDDPETSLSNGNIVGLASGTSNSGASGTNQYPNTRTVGFSLNLTF